MGICGQERKRKESKDKDSKNKEKEATKLQKHNDEENKNINKNENIKENKEKKKNKNKDKNKEEDTKKNKEKNKKENKKVNKNENKNKEENKKKNEEENREEIEKKTKEENKEENKIENKKENEKEPQYKNQGTSIGKSIFYGSTKLIRSCTQSHKKFNFESKFKDGQVIKSNETNNDIKESDIIKESNCSRNNILDYMFNAKNNDIKEFKIINEDNDSENNNLGNNSNKNILNSIKENWDSKNNDLNNNFVENKDYYFVCSRCKCRNPHIENLNFDINIKDFNVSYYCACLYNNNRPQEEPLHLLIDSQNPLNKCPIHSRNILKSYCKECKKFFCDLCEENNDDHIKDFINHDNIISEDNAKKILKESSKTKFANIYRKIIEKYLNQFHSPKYHLKNDFLEGHSDKVTALIQLDSGSIATGSYDTTIRIWDLERLSCIKIIQGLGKIFALLEFEENMLLSSSENIICLWDLKSDKNECIHKFDGHELWVNCLVKCDDKTFASASNDCSIIIWDYYKKSIIKKFEAHDDCILALIKLKDGNLCSGSVDKLIKIWNLKEEKSIKNLSGHKNWVKCLCQMDNETLLSGSDDKTIKVWKNYVCINTIKQHTHSVRVLLKINDDYFISGSFDKSIKIWDIKKYKCHQTINETSSALCIAKLNNNDLISSHSDNRVILWEKL